MVAKYPLLTLWLVWLVKRYNIDLTTLENLPDPWSLSPSCYRDFHMKLEIRAVLEGITPHSSKKDRAQEWFWRERKVKSQQSMEIMPRTPTLNCQCSYLFWFPPQQPTCLFPSDARCSKTKIASFIVSVFHFCWVYASYYNRALTLHPFRYDYRCVIYGWDHRCEMSDAWILQMGVDSLPHGRNQPFYNVLVEDGTNRYASEGLNSSVMLM